MTKNPTPLVLVVESDPIQRDIIQMVLKRLGCVIVQTRDPNQVPIILSKQHPSLLILDTFLPGSSGLEILKELNQQRLLKHTAVLIVSAYGFIDIIQQAKNAGADEFLIKPLDIDDLSKRIQSLLKI
jgi:CheY-like chemotaxis protein